MPLTSRRYYTNTAVQQQLSVQVNSTAVTFVVPTGGYGTWPNTFPFYAAVDYGQPTMEVVQVTAISGTNATVVRGQDGTSAVSHPAGATFEPVVTAKDFDEANAHSSTGEGVHGTSTQVVGIGDTQTLSNKTIDPSCTIQTPTITGTATLAGGHITGNSTVDGTSTVGTEHVTGSATIDGNETIGGTLGVAGKVTAGSLEATGAATFDSTVTDKRSLPMSGRTALSYGNQNANGSLVGANNAIQIVSGTWDSTELHIGDLVDHRGTDGSMVVTTPGLYRWHVLTSVPTTFSNGAHFAQGIAVNGTFLAERDARSTDGGGNTSGNGVAILAAGDKVQVAYTQSDSTSHTLTPLRFTLCLEVPSN